VATQLPPTEERGGHLCLKRVAADQIRMAMKPPLSSAKSDHMDSFFLKYI
jgi:hypothetical protein